MNKIPFFTNLLATGFYLGKMPFMPGTFGSLIAIPLAYITIYLTTLGKAIYFLIFFAIGMLITSRYVAFSGRHDPSEVVVDEYVALLLFYMVFPFKPVYIISGFILFRIYDILKPFPASYFDGIDSALGIMLDDIMAVVYAIFTMMVLKTVLVAFGVVKIW